MAKRSKTFRLSPDVIAVLEHLAEQYGVSEARIAEAGIYRELRRIIEAGGIDKMPKMSNNHLVGITGRD